MSNEILKNEICPGCNLACPLTDPQCGRGAAIAGELLGEAGGATGSAGEDKAGRSSFGHGKGRHDGWGRGEGHGEGRRGGHGGRGGDRFQKGEGGRGEGRRGPHGEGDRDGDCSPCGRGGCGDGRGVHHGEGRGHERSRGHHGRHGDDKLLVHQFHHCAHLLMHRRSKEGGRTGALMVLSRHGAMSQRALAEKLDIRSASVSELLSKMEQAGLITRSQDGSDRRAVVVELTDKGKAEAEALAAKREESNRSLFAVLSDEEKEQLKSILAKLTPYWHDEFAREEAADGKAASEEDI